MTTASDIAGYIKADRDAAGVHVTPLQMHRWLYLVAGTHRNLWDDIPFDSGFVADPTGPVLPNVGEPSAEGVNERLEPTIRLVLDRFPTGTPDETDRFTVAEGTPWADARASINRDSQDRPIIPRTEIDVWFAHNSTDPTFVSDPEADRLLIERIANGDTEALTALMS